MNQEIKIATITESENVVETETFEDMNLSENLMRGIFGYGFQKPSQIQKKAIMPMVNGNDLLAQAQSGTGKTGAFVIGSLFHVDEKLQKPQVLVLVHVHELAEQIADVATKLGARMKLKVLCAVGGNPVRDDIKALENGAQFIVGTPGRVWDLINRNELRRDHIKYLIMDEADQMLEELFYKQVLSILNKGFPMTTRVALFSATMPPQVIEVAEKILNDPIRVLIPPTAVRLDGIQQFYVNLDREEHKFDCICDLYKNLNITQAVIFCNKKQKADMLAEKMIAQGFPVTCIHGDLDKNERRSRMNNFRNGGTRVMISTDILARGIDIQHISLVINFELPSNHANYIHRIGRAGRYGRKGTTINLITQDDYKMLESICEYYGMNIKELPSDISKLL